MDQNCSKTYKYCVNTRENCTCRWTQFPSIGSILVSITSILAKYCHNTCKYWAGEYTLGFKHCMKVIYLATITVPYVWKVNQIWLECRLYWHPLLIWGPWDPLVLQKRRKEPSSNYYYNTIERVRISHLKKGLFALRHRQRH